MTDQRARENERLAAHDRLHARLEAIEGLLDSLAQQAFDAGLAVRISLPSGETVASWHQPKTLPALRLVSLPGGRVR